jgi:hypothetical protein
MSTVRGVINAESERVFCFLAAGWSYSLWGGGDAFLSRSPR